MGLFCGAFFLLIVFWKKIEKGYKMFIFSLGVILFFLFLIPNPMSERFYSSFDLNEGSNIGRMEMWSKAFETAKKNPFLGVGIGNYPLEVKASADYREPINAHNTYLDIAADTGIINAFFWIGIIAVAFMGYIRQSKKEIFFLFGAVSLVIFSVHSFFETSLYSPIVLPLFLIIISLSQLDDKKHI